LIEKTSRLATAAIADDAEMHHFLVKLETNQLFILKVYLAFQHLAQSAM
jgi:hypothetical protein